jgi:hypothetical protein
MIVAIAKRFVVVFAALLVSAAPVFAAVVGERPVIVEPVDRGQLPLMFSWTAISGGNVPVESRNRRTSATLPAPSYELQISDRSDVDSNVLVDVHTNNTTFFFTNTFPSSNFTLRADGPLAGGTYYCRVRAIFNASTTSEFSVVRSFVLATSTGAGGTSVHDYAITDILPVGTLVAGVPGTVLVRVRNTGTFVENSGSVSFTFDGSRVGSASIPALAPGESALLSYPVAPARAGIAALQARLLFADQGEKNNTLEKTVDVRASGASATLLHGRIRRDPGGFVLIDSQGRIVADLTAGDVDLAAYVDKPVIVSGTLSTGNGRFAFAVRSVVPDAGVK